jgi:hypothetical protein
MTIVNDSTRQQLMDTVPNTAVGSTCIGCGLQMAIDVNLHNAYCIVYFFFKFDIRTSNVNAVVKLDFEIWR